MYSYWLTLSAKILLAITAFFIPILVGFPWFVTLRPEARLSIILIGVFVVSISTYLTEFENREEFKKLQRELDTDKKAFADIFLSEVLKILLETLRVPGHARAAIYLKDLDGNLKVAFDYGMKGMPDYELEYRPKHGWCWDVWKTTESTFCDLEKLGRRNVMKNWKFTRGQFNAIWSA